MAIGYRPSGSISVFPSTYRKDYPSGKFTSETNFANIIKSIVDNDRYVLSYKNNILELVINGYYFKIEGMGELPDWAAIKVEQDLVGRGYNLVNFTTNETTLDTGGNFYGVAFGNNSDSIPSAPTGYRIYSLQLKDGNGKPIYRRISANSIYWPTNDNIDSGKTITEEINSKQSSLKAGKGINIYQETTTGDNYIKVIDKYTDSLDSLKDGSAETPQLIYFNGNGILGRVDATRGSGWSTASGVNKVGLTYLNNGVITNNITINYSTSDPGSAAGQNGDIWIKFSN